MAFTLSIDRLQSSWPCPSLIWTRRRQGVEVVVVVVVVVVVMGLVMGLLFFSTSLFKKHAFIMFNKHPSCIHNFVILPQVNIGMTRMCSNKQYARIKPD